MATSAYPFLAALDHPELTEVTLADIDGDLLKVNVDTESTSEPVG